MVSFAVQAIDIPLAFIIGFTMTLQFTVEVGYSIHTGGCLVVHILCRINSLGGVTETQIQEEGGGRRAPDYCYSHKPFRVNREVIIP